METIIFTYENAVATVKLNRPEKRNAVNRQMTEELSKVLRTLKEDEHVKSLILTGEGEEAFCAGGDLNELHGDLTEVEAYSLLSPMRDVLYELATLPIPTLAWLNGDARGGGCELASACDVRYGRMKSDYGFIQGRLGIVPGWGEEHYSRNGWGLWKR
ncbi:enoyl-CoA hydratase/isomerase family protein [Salimicrobium sp. PL1-032A]|uniref:enoyl-CoA hydratase/isomerase family protein n=1 Tax=Salimicrobium sp. PL1-032A TaxID=3095364 RepID=UPI0032603CE3